MAPASPQSALQRLASNAHYIYDVNMCAINILFGNLLPSLHVPPKDLSGKVAIITGANSGIGYHIALRLAQDGATVLLACRNMSKGEDAAEAITEEVMRTSKASQQDRSEVRSRVKVVKLDTSSMSSVRTFAETWQKDFSGGQIDILVNNAGIGSISPGQEVTEDGLGTMYATNFLGSFLLTNLLEQFLAPQARVVFTSSTGQYGGKLSRHETAPRGIWHELGLMESEQYGDTKVMQVAFAYLLQQRWNRQRSGNDTASAGRIAHSFSPGYTYTAIFDKIPSSQAFSVDPGWWLLKVGTKLSTHASQGAMTGVWLATTDDEAVLEGGKFWDRMAQRMTPVDFVQEGTLRKLWEAWERDAGVSWD